MAKKKGLLGCSPLLIGVTLVFLAVFAISFLSGPLGKSMFSSLALPEWLSVTRPEPELPAETVFHLLGFPIANTVISAWVTVLFLVLGSWLITRRMKVVPGRLQGIFEALLGWLYSFCQNVAGEQKGRQFFPVVATIFLFVAFNAWLSLLPGYGSITIESGGHEVHLLRAANTDINMPLALAFASGFFVIFYGLKTLRIGFLAQYFNFGPFISGLVLVFKGKAKAGFGKMFIGFIYIVVGFLELLSMFVRVVSFTFRLFGVSTAGEILLVVGVFLGIHVLIEFFYGMEILFGFVQALIFGGLTLVFLTLATTGHGEHQEEKH